MKHPQSHAHIKAHSLGAPETHAFKSGGPHPEPQGDNPPIEHDDPRYFSQKIGTPRVNAFDQAGRGNETDAKGLPIHAEDLMTDHDIGPTGD
jgi:hypothetical protein